MSLRLTLAVTACFTLVACDGNPFDNAPVTPTDPTTPTTPVTPPTVVTPVPAALQGNLRSVVYNATAGTLSVVITPLSGSTQTAATPITFTRAPALDTKGFEAFTYQETGSNRYTVAYFDTSASGAASASVAGSAQFTEMVWGTTYSANEAFSAPENGGLASYSGRYTGILNSGTAVSGTNPGSPFDPRIPQQVEGEVFVNADFTNNALEGGIRDRTVVGTTTGFADVFLQISTINPADGSFAGTVVFSDLEAAGTFGGTFAGEDASSVAGAIEITPISGNSDLLERGVFVADKCVAGDPLPCPQ